MQGYAFTCCLIIAISFFDLRAVHGDDANKDPHFAPGHDAIVHLFEWRWDDIAAECENFLGPYGFGGVQVSPPNENAVINDPTRPWWERYQPVSYVLVTRSGDRNAFTDMVQRCNAVNVRVYVDVVANHMVGEKDGPGQGTAGNPFNADTQSFPTVPYDISHFHTCAVCGTPTCWVIDADDPDTARNCRLSGLLDLDHSQEYVRDKIIAFLNDLIDIGVAGFRFDAAKHIWPVDMQSMVSQTKPLRSDIFGENAKPFVFQEVADFGNQKISYTQYSGIGRVTEFQYGADITLLFRKQKELQYMFNFGEGWKMMNRSDAVVFVDNHDKQREIVGDTCSVLTFFESYPYKMAVAFMLAHPYGIPRIMSSFSWPRDIEGGKDLNSWYGPPHDDQFNILHVTFNEDLSCSGDRVCEHRWRQIYNMVRFRNAVSGTDFANWWHNGANQIGFGRGDKGFLVINGETFDLEADIYTAMAAGTYCDVISGNLDVDKKKCTAKVVEVYADGTAHFSISGMAENPMIAIHVNAKLN